MWPFTRKPIDKDELDLTVAILDDARDVTNRFFRVDVSRNSGIYCAALVDRDGDFICRGFGDIRFTALRNLAYRVAATAVRNRTASS